LIAFDPSPPPIYAIYIFAFNDHLFRPDVEAVPRQPGTIHFSVFEMCGEIAM
jgi:hypothetical protein